MVEHLRRSWAGRVERSRIAVSLTDALPAAGMFSRGKGTLDPRVFDPITEQVRPEIRQGILDLLDGYWGLPYGDWRRWARVYIAGSAASYWWDSDHDLDVLIGIDKQALDAARPQNLLVTEAEVAQHLSRGLKEDLNPQTADWLGFSVTFYVNPGSYDIREIRPYAAYDLSSDAWVVRPPVLPNDWGPEAFPVWWWKRAEAVADRIREVLALAEPQRTRLGVAIFNDLHAQRQNAYSPFGHGWQDWGNFLWQALSQWRLLQPLYALKHPEG